MAAPLRDHPTNAAEQAIQIAILFRSAFGLETTKKAQPWSGFTLSTAPAISQC